MKHFFLLLFLCFIVSGCSKSPIQKAWEAKQKALVTRTNAYIEHAEVYETLASYWDEIANAWEENPEAWEAYADTVSQENDVRAFGAWQKVQDNNSRISIRNSRMQVIDSLNVVIDDSENQIRILQNRYVETQNRYDSLNTEAINNPESKLNILRSRLEETTEINDQANDKFYSMPWCRGNLKCLEESDELFDKMVESSKEIEEIEKEIETENYTIERTKQIELMSINNQINTLRAQIQKAQLDIQDTEEFISNYPLDDVEKITVEQFAIDRAEQIRTTDKQNYLDMSESSYEIGLKMNDFIKYSYSANIQEEIELAKLYAEQARNDRDEWGENGWINLEISYELTAKAWDEAAKEWEKMSHQNNKYNEEQLNLEMSEYQKQIEMEYDEMKAAFYEGSMTPESLDAAFLNNPVAADMEYRGNPLIIIGEVQNIMPDYISFEGDERVIFPDGVGCYFNDKTSFDILLQINRWDIVKVRGVLAEKRFGSFSVNLHPCYIIDTWDLYLDQEW